MGPLSRGYGTCTQPDGSEWLSQCLVLGEKSMPTTVSGKLLDFKENITIAVPTLLDSMLVTLLLCSHPFCCLHNRWKLVVDALSLLSIYFLQ